MQLNEQVYKIIRQELFNNSITAYSDYIPDEIKYPFVMYEIIKTEMYPDISFNKDSQKLTVRFNMYSSKDNPEDAMAIAEQIENLFNRTQLVFVDSDNAKNLICNFKVNDSISFLEQDTYWLCISDYEFIADRNF